MLNSYSLSRMPLSEVLPPAHRIDELYAIKNTEHQCHRLCAIIAVIFELGGHLKLNYQHTLTQKLSGLLEAYDIDKVSPAALGFEDLARYFNEITASLDAADPMHIRDFELTFLPGPLFAIKNDWPKLEILKTYFRDPAKRNAPIRLSLQFPHNS